jgi:hypothetical protein
MVAIAVCATASVARAPSTQNPQSVAGGLSVARVLSGAGAPSESVARMVPLSELPLVSGPSIGVRHHALDRLDLPESGVEISLNCALDSAAGRFVRCSTLAEAHSRTREGTAARRIAMANRFDGAQVSQRYGGPVRSLVTVKLDPANRVHMTAPRTDEIVPVQWAQPFSERAFESTISSTRLFLSKNVMVHILCQIQSDFSATCLPASSEPEGINLSSADLYWIVSEMRAEPRLADGRPSAGQWTQITQPLERIIIVSPSR